MIRKLSLLLIPCLLLMSFSAPAWAQQRPTAVLIIEGKGLDGATASTLTSIVRSEAKQQSSFSVIEQTPVSLSDVVLLLGCDASTNACLTQAANQLRVKLLVFGRLDKESDGQSMRLEIFDAEQQRVTHRFQQLITDRDVIVSYRVATERFFKELDQEAQLATLRINSNVRGAAVLLNGKEEGTTPFERTGLKPGLYKIEVVKEGFSSWSAELELDKRAELKLNAPLKPNSPIIAQNPNPTNTTDPKTQTNTIDPSKDPELRLNKGSSPSEQYDAVNWGGWSLLGVGGAALIGSGVMTILMKDVEQELRDRYDGNLTRAEYDELVARGERYELAQRVLLGVGVASATIGAIWLLVDDGDAQESTKLRLGITPTGVQAELHW